MGPIAARCPALGDWGLNVLARLRDVLDDVVTGHRRRIGRAVLFAAGAAVAATLFSWSAVYSSSAATEVANSFDELAATRLQVHLPVPQPTYPHVQPEQLEAIKSIDGVRGVLLLGTADVRLTTIRQPSRGSDVSTELFTAVGDLAVLDDDVTVEEEGLGNGAMLGGGLASREDLREDMTIELDGRPTRIHGRIDRSPVVSDVLFGVLRPGDPAALAEVSSGVLVVQVRQGWADRVAPHLAAVLNPNRPDRVHVQYPPEAGRLRAAVVTRVDGLVVAVAASLLILSALVVGIATFAHVIQNRRLIGMRRAIGASAAEIAAGLLLDVTVTATAGAAVGTLIGTAAAALTSAYNGLTLTVPTGWLLAGIAAAMALNALAALPPTLHAVRIDPARAIQAR